MAKIILDTNVILAAFASRGLCNSIFELCLDRYEIVISEEILEELARNMHDKIKLPASKTKHIITFLKENCIVSKIHEADKSKCEDKNDLHILGLAQKSGAKYVITGDKDLLKTKVYKNTKFVAPRDLWEINRKNFSDYINIVNKFIAVLIGKVCKKNNTSGINDKIWNNR
ncbi:putative toxin-antitoxin system toxin component, PIN family [Candidatus Desantisbacteria bacterium]|nr:putative toxin-antitoxin system toxin component, PIN family [Candidatus Desantisbacteria bacterium]